MKCQAWFSQKNKIKLSSAAAAINTLRFYLFKRTKLSILFKDPLNPHKGVPGTLILKPLWETQIYITLNIFSGMIPNSKYYPRVKVNGAVIPDERTCDGSPNDDKCSFTVRYLLKSIRKLFSTNLEAMSELLEYCWLDLDIIHYIAIHAVDSEVKRGLKSNSVRTGQPTYEACDDKLDARI